MDQGAPSEGGRIKLIIKLMTGNGYWSNHGVLDGTGVVV